MFITIFTPTYNRAYIIGQLYQSLCNQDSFHFEWLIVDDGSTDNTKELVSSFIGEGVVNIRYVYQENGGKQRAINKGVQLADGELFFIVDSDDCLTPDAVSSVEKAWNTLLDKTGYAGFCFRRLNLEVNKILGGPFPEFIFDATSLELAYSYSLNIDKAEVFLTNVLKKFPFPEIDGEKFVPEALVWYRIADEGLKLHCIDYGIYCCKYLPDGYTRNFSSNLKRNNKGFFLFYKELLHYDQPSFYPDKVKAFVRMMQCVYFRLFH